MTVERCRRSPPEEVYCWELSSREIQNEVGSWLMMYDVLGVGWISMNTDIARDSHVDVYLGPEGRCHRGLHPGPRIGIAPRKKILEQAFRP